MFLYSFVSRVEPVDTVEHERLRNMPVAYVKRKSRHLTVNVEVNAIGIETT